MDEGYVESANTRIQMVLDKNAYGKQSTQTFLQIPIHQWNVE